MRQAGVWFSLSLFFSFFTIAARAAVPFPPPECPNTKPDPATEAFCGGINSPCENITMSVFCMGQKIKREIVYSGCVANTDTECKNAAVLCYREYVCRWVIDPDPTVPPVCMSDVLVTSATDYKKILVGCDNDPPP